MKNKHVDSGARWWHRFGLGLSLLMSATLAQAQVVIGD